MDLLAITKLNDEEIQTLIEQLKVDKPPALKDRNKINNLVYDAMIKQEVEAETKARAELQVKNSQKLKDLGVKEITNYDSPEAKAIRESKKVYALFKNIANPGVSERFNKGCVYTFTIYDGKVHILPEWLIRDFSRSRAGTEPKHDKKMNPVTGQEVHYQSGVDRKYFFQVLEEVPEKESAKYKADTGQDFGVVLDSSILKRLNVVDDSVVQESEITV